MSDWEDDDPVPSPQQVQPIRRNGRGRMAVKDKRAVSMEINTNHVGKVIGRGGSVIRKLQSDTNTQIFINDSDNSCTYSTEVIIKGHSFRKQAEDCRDRINELLGYKPLYDCFAGLEIKKDEEKFVPIDWQAWKIEEEIARKQRWEKCPPLKKVFYQEHPEVTSMTEEQVVEFRSCNNHIVVSNFSQDGDGTPLNLKPCPEFYHSFHNFPEILETIKRQGFARPSPIQAQAWPYLLSGQDVIGIAQTGTGKTLAFLMPSFIHIDNQELPRDKRGGPNVLVLSPTRELALQIDSEVKKYEYHGIRSVCVYGGGKRREQMASIDMGVQIIIATPGRLNDLVEAGCIKIESVTYLVLDEADRMLDLGFEPQIRKLMLDIRPDRQTVMTSATWPSGVRRLASTYMSHPVTIFIGSLDLEAVGSVTQQILFVNEEDKMDVLTDFLNQMQPHDKVIVFVGKKSRVDHIASDLCLANIPCQSIHGDRAQEDREQALEDLKTGYMKILIATDVASRGIDIEDVTHVINLDFPRNIEEYVHRVGRTGRAGRTGTSITFVERKDWGFAAELIDILSRANQEVPDELVHMAERFSAYKQRQRESGGRRGRGGYRGSYGS